jgi:manganese/zinc/iron transport system permease protein
MRDVLDLLGMSPLTLRAIVVAAVCSVSCALLGCYLVLRRISLIGDAISHAVLPGIVLGYLLTGQVTGAPVILGAMALGLLTAWLTQMLQSSGKVTEDSSMGIVFTALFAVGVLMVARVGNVDLDVECVLYGNLLNASLHTFPLFGVEVPVALKGMTLVLGLTLVFITLLWKELKITSFDPALARSMGISAGLVYYLLMSMVGGVTVAAFEAVGAILVVAMLIVPAACAQMLTDRLGGMLVWATLVALVSSLVGYRAAEALNTTPAGMMAVVAGLQLLLAVLFAPRHGMLSRVIRNARLGVRIAAEDVLACLYRAGESRGEDVSLRTAEARRAVRRVGRLASWLAIPTLRRLGQVRLAGKLLVLTDEGRRRAESLVRAHRLWESYLGENLALPPDHLHEPAERMEHFLDPLLQEEIARELQQPGIDPHGRPIP